ncbi:MAG: Peptidase family M54 [Planctomycetes bacterium ADurb.Bin126]|nr:MAG: Peptidase family M54 [Planctomycetes bacterium ADurb.Bin126]HOD81917.1 archaemetzincin [Phycisphaerae bacterium]HQL74131.1 archaemetzincin [Phycisphaerae bacterium]
MTPLLPPTLLTLGLLCLTATANDQPAAGKAETPKPPTPTELVAVRAKLVPLHRPLGKPGPHDWLASHPEPGQTFEQYLAGRPTLPRRPRNVIYIQPLGEFTQPQRKIVTLTADFMGRYFALAVKVQPDLPLALVPAKARRTHPTWGDKQILTSYVLDDILKPRLPKDAAAFIAFTASDLWPGEGWNFVFGQASLSERVGVWSIYRNGEPDKGEAAFRLCLLRTLKTATHETAHMFGLWHCTKYECNMCGSNNRDESDRRPVALCPECLAKVCWACQADPAERFGSLIEFCARHGLKDEAAFLEKSRKAIRP